MIINTGRSFGAVAFVCEDGHEFCKAKCVSVNSEKVTWIVLNSDVVGRFAQWQKEKTLIQDVFPDLSVNARELLLSGVGQEEWDDLFPEEDEEFDLYDDSWPEDEF